jgi:hypothetical protein
MLSIEYQAAISDAAERPVAMVWMGSAPEVQTIAQRMAEIYDYPTVTAMVEASDRRRGNS